jgi:hypothetical protein
VVFLHGYNVMKSLVIEWDGVLGDDGLPRNWKDVHLE